jgi:phage antirepressor YoqD-like protein
MSNSSLQRFDQNGIELIIDTQTGESFATAKGYSRMSGKDYDTVKKRCQRGGLLTAEVPTEQGFRWGTLITEDLISEWLPKDNPTMATQLMKLGVRVFMHKLAGFEISTTAVTHDLPSTYLEALKCLVASEEQKILLEQEKALLSAKIEQDAPLVDYAEAVQCSESAIELGDFAKMIGTGRNRLFQTMRDCGVIMQNSNIPFQKWINAGYFEVSQEIAGNGKLIPFALVTGKGQLWLKDRIRKYTTDHKQVSEQTSLFDENQGNHWLTRTSY